MKFFGEPGQLVRFTRKNMRNGRKIGFRFDDKGEYVTENKRLIQALKTRFKYEDEELPFEDKTEAYKASYDATDSIEELPLLDVEEVKFKCKKCDFTTDNKGSLMAHYRTHK